MAEYTLAQLAERLGCELSGDGAYPVVGVASLQTAGQNRLCFIDNGKYLPHYEEGKAEIVVTTADLHKRMQRPCHALITDKVRVVFSGVASLFEWKPDVPPGVSASATVASSATLGAGVHVGERVTIGEGVVIGDGTVVMTNAVIEANTRLGENCVIHPNVTLYHGIQLGDRVCVHAGTVIGSDGFGNAADISTGSWVKIPQLGSVRIGNDVEIGANTTIDRGALDDTVVHDDVKIDNLVQIAHNVVIGRHTAIAGCVGIAGSTIIGAHCLVGGACAINGHITIADHVMLTGSTTVASNITRPGVYSSVLSAQDSRTWHRNLARLKHLDEIVRKFMKKEG